MKQCHAPVHYCKDDQEDLRAAIVGTGLQTRLRNQYTQQPRPSPENPATGFPGVANTSVGHTNDPQQPDCPARALVIAGITRRESCRGVGQTISIDLVIQNGESAPLTAQKILRSKEHSTSAQQCPNTKNTQA